MARRPRRSTLFPYTTLFRSQSVTNTSFSLEAWVSPQDLPPTTCGTNSNTCGYEIGRATSELQSRENIVCRLQLDDIRNSSNQKFNVMSGLIVPGVYHHVAMT